MSRRLPVTALFACLPLTFALAAPTLNESLNQCDAADANMSVKGCTDAIQSGQLDNLTLAKVLNNRGAAYTNKASYDQAIANLTKAVALKPDYALAYNNRGLANAYKGTYDKAIADFSKAIELKADYDDPYNNRAEAYHLLGWDADGLADANKAVSLNPQSADDWETRAEIYEKLGRRDSALADYRKALSLSQDMKSANDGLARLGVAQ